MRKKAERQIRQAATSLGETGPYRIDQVRKGAGLIRKVYDKTILDMARLGTIALTDADTGEMTESEIGNLIHHRNRRYVYFRFLSTAEDRETWRPETVDIVLKAFDKEAWRRFAYYCRERENKEPQQKLEEMVRAYNRHMG
jgi:hypothetical protein